MPKTKSQKSEIIKELVKDVEKQKSMVFVEFKGLKTKDLLVLRKQLKKASATLRVVKKTLLQKVFAEKNIGVDLKKLGGQIAAIFALDDPILPAKAVYQFAKTNELVKVLGGYGDNTMYTVEMVKELASIPSREQLLGRLLGSISSPISRFMNVIQGNTKGLIVALRAMSEKLQTTNN